MIFLSIAETSVLSSLPPTRRHRDGMDQDEFGRLRRLRFSHSFEFTRFQRNRWTYYFLGIYLEDSNDWTSESLEAEARYGTVRENTLL